MRFPEDSIQGIDIPQIDKLVHFTFYFVAVILAFLYLTALFGKRVTFNKILLISLLFAWVYGIIMEVLQSTLTTARSGEMYDVWANCFGGLIGVLLIKLWFSGRRTHRVKQ